MSAPDVLPADREAASVDHAAEYEAFKVWARGWLPHQPMPASTSHMFDAWLGSARHRQQAISGAESVLRGGDFLKHLRSVNEDRLAAWEQPMAVMLCEHCGAQKQYDGIGGTFMCAPPFVSRPHEFTKPHPYITREPRKTDGIFHAAELGGEVGEVLNVVKKLHREEMGWRGSRATKEQLAEEIGDVLICLDKLAAHYGIDIATATIAKFNATSDKVGLPHNLTSSEAALANPTPAPEAKGVGMRESVWADARLGRAYELLSAVCAEWPSESGVHDGLTIAIREVENTDLEIGSLK